MKKKTSEMTIAELRARAAEIRTEVNAEGADLDALEAEADEISQRIAQYETEQRRLGIAAKVADGAGAPQDNPTASTDAQTRAQQFKENRRAVLGVEETRAVLVSGGKLATPTEVNTEIQDRVGVGVSSIIDMVWVDDCAGMSLTASPTSSRMPTPPLIRPRVLLPPPKRPPTTTSTSRPSRRRF